MKAPALKANAIQMGTPDNPVVFVGVSAGNPNQVIERGVMDNLVSSEFRYRCMVRISLCCIVWDWPAFDWLRYRTVHIAIARHSHALQYTVM